jgi:roadblock/LC7 domain-containing protein
MLNLRNQDKATRIFRFGRSGKINYSCFLYTFLTLPILSIAEPNTDTIPKKITFSGFVKHDIFYDTRQTVNAREALVTLYPEKVLLGKNGSDINSRHSLNMLNIHSRLRCEIRGPSILGAETTALLEGDFYGNENKNFSDLNGLRLFNAHIGFAWKTTHLQLGQDWHPMSIQGFFPGVVSFSAGAPFHPMSRNPQIRFRQTLGRFKVMGALLAQRDFTGTGPAGPGSQYLRNSGIPNIHVQGVYASDSSIISAGVGLDYKKIVPELFTSNNKGEIFKTNSVLASMSATCFMELRANRLTVKVQGVYAQNAYDQLMIGGYGVSGREDEATGDKSYSNLNTVSSWADFQSRWKKFSFGVFTGYTGNLGTSRRITGAIYARGGEIKCVYRVAPRVTYTVKNVGISLEGEYTTAFYGVENGDQKGRVTQADAVSNIRALLSVRYSF